MKKSKRMKPVFKKMYAGGNPDEDNSGMNAYNQSGVTAFNPTGDMTSGYNWASTNGAAGTAGAGVNPWATAGRYASAIAPFASNIANSFRTPPLPRAPTLVNPVTLPNISLAASRAGISRAVRSQDLAADKTMPSQTAAALHSSNLAREIEGTSQVSEQETFLNARNRAESAGMNLNAETINANAQDHYNSSILERNIANQREQSANLSNASDKYISEMNEERKANLDMQKMGVLSQMWKNSGVYDRMLGKMKDQGIDDPTGIMGQMGYTTHAMGGSTRAFSAAEGGSMYARGGTIPHPVNDPGFQQWYRYNTYEGRRGIPVDKAGKDYYDEYLTGRTAESMDPMSVEGAHPNDYTMNRGQYRSGGRLPVYAEGGDPPGAATLSHSMNSGYEDVSTVSRLNSLLAGTNSKIPVGFGADADALAMQAYMWHRQNAGRSPEETISGFYDRPVNTGNTQDALRQRLGKIGYGPTAMYYDTPDVTVRRPFGGFTAAAKPFKMTHGRATGQSMISPWGGGRSGNLGAGIPMGKFNPKHITNTRVFDKGGSVSQFQIENPDMLMTNGHTSSANHYKMGGTFMDYPVRPKAIRQMDFAGIEHMAHGGYTQGGQMGHIPTGAFEEDHINGPRPTPGPDDTMIGMDILKKGGWIKKAVNPAHKGYCTPMTKSTCTPRRKAFAMTMKKHHGFHAAGGVLCMGGPVRGSAFSRVF